MKVNARSYIIINWIKDYCSSAHVKPKALIVGISGGVDSAVVSTLCAKTDLKTIVLSMPINQIKSQHELSLKHGEWLKKNFGNVEHHILEMDNIFKSFSNLNCSFSESFAFSNSLNKKLL